MVERDWMANEFFFLETLFRAAFFVVFFVGGEEMLATRGVASLDGGCLDGTNKHM